MTTIVASPRMIQVFAPVAATRTAGPVTRTSFWTILLRALSAVAA